MTVPSVEACQQSFARSDRDDSGFIDISELRQVLENLGQSPSDDQLKAMSREADVDGSGKISLPEFIKVMRDESRSKAWADVGSLAQDTLTRMHDAQRVGMASLQKHMTEMTGQLKSLKKNLKNTSEERDRLANENQRLWKDNTQLHDNNKAIQEQITSVSSGNQELEAANRNFAAQAQQQSQQLSQIQQSHAHQQNNLQKATQIKFKAQVMAKQLKSYQLKHKQQQQELQLLETDKDKMRRELNSANTHNETLETMMEKMREDLENVRGEYRLAKDDNDKLFAEKLRLKAEVRNAVRNGHIGSMNKDIDQLEAEGGHSSRPVVHVVHTPNPDHQSHQQQQQQQPSGHNVMDSTNTAGASPRLEQKMRRYSVMLSQDVENLRLKNNKWAENDDDSSSRSSSADSTPSSSNYSYQSSSPPSEEAMTRERSGSHGNPGEGGSLRSLQTLRE